MIGINTYSAPAEESGPVNPRGVIKDLKGAVNDARAMQAILINRFQFNPDQIDTLINRMATREAIIESLKKLLERSKANDYVVIFYAGHGSQVKNSLSKESDQKDETIVPSDAWKAGVKDIRDKELSTLYNQFLDKGIRLTVIMDCCHSGSLSRGPQPPPVYRFVEDAQYDAKDASNPTPPETRSDKSFLIFSAAQSDELAQEQVTPDAINQGAFTLALTQALEQLGPNAACSQLFTSARAILKSYGKKQEPVMGGSANRQQQTLFGMEKGIVPDRAKIAVLDDPKNPITRRRVLLQGGFAVGLRKENELVKFAGQDTLVRLIVDTVLGPNRAQARVAKGNLTDLKAGEWLTVTNWVSSQAPLLKIYLPPSPDETAYKDLLSSGLQLKKKFASKWITELDKGAPDQSIYSDIEGFHCVANGKRNTIGKKPPLADIQKIIQPQQEIYWEMPPSGSLTQSIRAMSEARNNPSIQWVDKLEDATYWVAGIINEKNQIAYRLRRAQVDLSDTLGSLPLLTRAVTLATDDPASAKAVADSLYEFALRLARIRGWIQLAAPVNENTDFPFQLVMRNNATKEVVTADRYKIGDNIELSLEASPTFKRAFAKNRYVYLFMIDRDGKMQPLYPDPSEGNVDNKFPRYVEGELVAKTLLAAGTVEGPIGTDSYYILATDEAIPNYAAVFQQAGVRAISSKFPLKSIMMTGMEGNTRSNTKTPTNWSLIRRSIICVNK